MSDGAFDTGSVGPISEMLCCRSALKTVGNLLLVATGVLSPVRYNTLK